MFVLDSDDKTASEYPDHILVTPTGDPVGPSNEIALKSTADIIGWMGDDSRFETKGWDERVTHEMSVAGGGFCWTAEGHVKPWPSTIFISRDIVQGLGWLVFPNVKRGYFDVAWLQLARLTGRAVVLRDVMIRHRNVPQGVPPDTIHADEAAFNLWCKKQCFQDASRIRLSPDRLRAVGDRVS